jgi:hypothetical protein
MKLGNLSGDERTATPERAALPVVIPFVRLLAALPTST